MKPYLTLKIGNRHLNRETGHMYNVDIGFHDCDPEQDLSEEMSDVKPLFTALPFLCVNKQA